MRFHFGAVPLAPEFVIDGPWKPLYQISFVLLQLAAFPLAVIAPAILLFLFLHLTPIAIIPLKSGSLPSSWIFLLGIVFTVLLHEVAHMVAHPMSGRSSRSVLGCWPAMLVFYANYEGEVTRNRFIAIALMPFLVISFVPLLVMAVTHSASPLIVLLSLVNSSMSCVDLFVAGLLLYQIPSRAIVRNQGWRTYWKAIEP